MPGIMDDPTDDLILMNAEQAKKVPFPPSSLVYIYNNESPPYIMAAGEVKAVFLKLEFGITCGTQVFFKVELSPGRTASGHSIGSDIYGENRKNVLMKASQLRFRNGCPVNVNIQMQESTEGSTTQKNVPGSVIGIYDVPSGNGNGRNKTGNTGYRYSIQVFENVPGLNSEEPRVLQNIKPELVRFRESSSEGTRDQIPMQQVSSNTADERVAQSFAHHVKEEPQDVSSEEEPNQDIPIIKEEPRGELPDIVPSNGIRLTQPERSNNNVNTVTPIGKESSKITRKRRRIDLLHEPTQNTQRSDQHFGNLSQECRHLYSKDESVSMTTSSEENDDTSTLTTKTRASNMGASDVKLGRLARNESIANISSPNVRMKLLNTPLDSGLRSRRDEDHVDLVNVINVSKDNSQDQESPRRESRTDAVHWRYIPPGRSEENVKNVGDNVYYWHQEYNSGKGMWSMHRLGSDDSPPPRKRNAKSLPLTSRKQINNVVSSHKPRISSVTPCRVIRLPGFSKKDIFNAAIGPKGRIHKQLVLMAKVKKLEVYDLDRTPAILIQQDESGMNVDSAVETILKYLRRKLNSSLREVSISDYW